MFIPYDFLYQKINYKPLKDFFYRKKIEQNCAYIAKNKKKVLKRLKNKQVLKVVFYVYDSCKWKCQTIYNEMLENPRFEPCIIVTKNSAKNLDNPSYQSKTEILETFNFFKNKGMNVKLGYDFEKNKHVPFKNFAPDIIIYQHPWYVETSQGPVVCSKFALTAYIPYDIATTTLEIEYNLRFFQYVENYYVINETLKNFYAPLMDNKGINLKAVGSPSLDVIKDIKSDKNYVIYAPHWTINHKNTIAYSTFKETGKFILEYAQKHPEFNWIFKPHPLLKKALLDNGFMSEEETNSYYSAWESLGQACYNGDYFELFNNSQLMITDCCTFLMEYFATGKPLIRLVSQNSGEFNANTQNIIKYFYNIENIEELENSLNKLLIEKLDPLKSKREKESQNYRTNATENIINDLIQQVS